MTESLHSILSEETPEPKASGGPTPDAPASEGQAAKEASPNDAAPDDAAKLEAQIQAVLAAPFEVRLRQHNRRHSLSIPELGVVVGGKDLAAAHKELSALRERRIREFASEGMLHLVNRPAETAASVAERAPGTLARLKPFLIKCLIVSVLFLMGVNLLGQRLGDVGYVLEKKLQGLSNWTPEQVEWHRARSEQIALKLGPTIRELLAMFRDTAPAAAPAAESATPRPAQAPAVEPVPVAPAAALAAPAQPEAAPATTTAKEKPAPEKPTKKRAQKP